MKRFILTLLFLSLAVPAYPWGGSMMVVGGGTPAAGGGPTYLFQETFDGSVGCNITANTTCENSWTVVDGGSYDTQGTGLEGTYGLVLTDTAARVSVRNTNNYTTADPIYLYFQVKFGVVSGLNAADVDYVAALANSASTRICNFGVRNNTTDKFAVQAGGGTAYLTTQPVADTLYHVWGKITKGSGTGSCEMWVSTVGTKPASTPGDNYNIRSSLTITEDAVRVILYGNTDKTEPITFDRVLIDDAEIGSSP